MNPSQNDSFGSFSSGQGGYIGQPGANSAGPVMLNSDGKKKSKKWVWILIVLIMVVLIGAIILIKMSSSSSLYNSFRNLVLYGDELDDGDYPNEDGLYAIQNANFWNDQQKMSGYYEKVRLVGDNLKNEVVFTKRSISQYVEAISLWTYASTFYYYNDEETIKIFESDGYKKALDYINNKYNQFIATDYKTIKNVGSLLVDAEVAYLEYINAFEENGCKISKLEEECEDRDDEISTDYIDKVNSSSSEIYDDGWALLKDAINNILEKKTL